MSITRQDLIDFVVHEARLLDAKRYDEWNALFTDDAFYWVPLVPDQEDGVNHTSHLYEDKLLRELRIERLKSPRAFSQQPPSRCHHLLQVPAVEEFDAVGAASWADGRLAALRAVIALDHAIPSLLRIAADIGLRRQGSGERRRIEHAVMVGHQEQGIAGRRILDLRQRCGREPLV